MNSNKIFFTAGPPVCGETFFGRENHLHRISEHIESGNSILLLGQRRIGKTSILRQLQHLKGKNLLKGIDSYPILTSFQGMSLPQRSSADELGQALIRSIFRSMQDQTKTIRDTLNLKLPSALLGSFKLKDSPSIINRWDALDILHKINSAGIPLLLFFDEIDDAIRATSGEAGIFLRSIINEGHLVAIATSYLWPDRIMGVDSSFGSAWFNVFYLMEVGLFTSEEANKMLKTLSKRSGYEFSDQACEFLVEMFGKQPFYLQLAGSEAFSLSPIASDTEMSVLKAASERVFENLLPLHFLYIIEHLTPKEFNTLQRISNGKSIKDKTIEKGLIKYGLLEKVGSKLRISSTAFAEFIKSLPKPTLGEKFRESDTVKAAGELGKESLFRAIEKSIEIASKPTP